MVAMRGWWWWPQGDGGRRFKHLTQTPKPHSHFPVTTPPLSHPHHSQPSLHPPFFTSITPSPAFISPAAPPPPLPGPAGATGSRIPARRGRRGGAPGSGAEDQEENDQRRDVGERWQPCHPGDGKQIFGLMALPGSRTGRFPLSGDNRDGRLPPSRSQGRRGGNLGYRRLLMGIGREAALGARPGGC